MEFIFIYFYISFLKCFSQHFLSHSQFFFNVRVWNWRQDNKYLSYTGQLAAMLAALHAQEVAVGAILAGPYL